VALYLRDRKPKPKPRYRLATLLMTRDRFAYARADDGDLVKVVIPNGMWPSSGDRVALFRYPDGWVAVYRVVISPPLSHEEE
jgi:hypothetical protein